MLSALRKNFTLFRLSGQWRSRCRRERARRNAVQSSSSIFARILINDKLIDKTPPM